MFPNLVYVSKQSSGNMELITTQRGKENVLFEGYRYTLDCNNLDGSSLWRCVRRDCVGRGKKLLDGSFIEIVRHAHAPDNAKNDAEKIKAEMRHYSHCCQLMEPDCFLTICEE